MSPAELLWAAASLLLLGALVSMCMTCRRSGTKRDKEQNKYRHQHANQQGFEVIRSYSVTLIEQDPTEWPEKMPVTRKTNKKLQATSTEGDNGEPRYQNFMRENRQNLDAIYVSPIATDYYNCGQLLRSAHEKEDDSCSYENMVVGVPNSSESDDIGDYENSEAIQTWQQSCMSDDDDSDYVNSDVATMPH